MSYLADSFQTVTKKLPAAAANTSTDAIDLRAVGGLGPPPTPFRLVVGVGATPSLANAISITFTIEHSDTGTSGWTTAPGLNGELAVTGAGGAGAAAAEWELTPNRHTKRYVRANAAVGATGGDNTAVDFYLKGAI